MFSVIITGMQFTVLTGRKEAFSFIRRKKYGIRLRSSYGSCMVPFSIVHFSLSIHMDTEWYHFPPRTKHIKKQIMCQRLWQLLFELIIEWSDIDWCSVLRLQYVKVQLGYTTQGQQHSVNIWICGAPLTWSTGTFAAAVCHWGRFPSWKESGHNAAVVSVNTAEKQPAAYPHTCRKSWWCNFKNWAEAFLPFFLNSDNIRTAVYKTVLALQKWSGQDQKLSTRRLANQ